MEDVQLQQDGGRHGIELPAPATSPPADGAAWLAALRGTGRRHDEAVGALYDLLVSEARVEIARRWARLAYACADDDAVDELAAQAADDALVALLSRLDDYRGDSRFTTWACKFAVLEAGSRARRCAWRRRDVVLDSDSWSRLAEPADRAGGGPGPVELLAAMADVIGAGLSGHQRSVLVALAIDRVPIDVLAERLHTTRAALYATLHDARRELRCGLDERGLSFDEA